MDSRTHHIFEELVGFDTVSRNSNLPLINYLAEHLGDAGAECQILPSSCGAKANLLARFGPADRPGVMFSGHSDVVPVEGQPWATDPFTLTQHEDKLFGRGSADMKGFIAVVTAKLLSLDSRQLTRPVYLAVTYDEEIGCLGVPDLIAYMKDMTVLPDLCIVGEPTSMGLATGHKGSNSYSVDVISRPTHSSFAPLEVNSIEVASHIIHRLTQLAGEFEQSGPFDNDYCIPFATVHTGLIKGGTQVNIVPDFCHFQFEFRTLASQDPDEVESQIMSWINSAESVSQSKVADSRIDVTRNYGYPGLETDKLSAGYQLATQARGGAALPLKLAFGAEAGSYQRFLGVSSIVCGPGDIAQAHQADEYVSINQISECETFVDKMIALSQRPH